jgi:hypothetical protein
MNYAQLKGERMVRCDPRWSPLAVPLVGMADALMGAAVNAPVVDSFFACGHARTPANTTSFNQKNGCHVERCRRCHNADSVRRWRVKQKAKANG